MLIYGDSNDRFLAAAAATAYGLELVHPSPLKGSCSEVWTNSRNVSWRGTPCPVYAGPDPQRPILVIGVAILAGTVLFADSGGINSPFVRGAFASQYTNTTRPAIRALRDFMDWNNDRPPDLLMMHSSLRDIYRLCRMTAPEADEAAAGNMLSTRPMLSPLEIDGYAANLGKLTRTLSTEVARNGWKGSHSVVHAGGSKHATRDTPETNTIIALHTLPKLDNTQGLHNHCLNRPAVVNGLVTQINELTRAFAASAGLPCFSWDAWLANMPAQMYMRPIHGGPHLVDGVLVELFRAMMRIMAPWIRSTPSHMALNASSKS